MIYPTALPDSGILNRLKQSNYFKKMEISEIVKTEQENTQIVLHKEGLFACPVKLLTGARLNRVP